MSINLPNGNHHEDLSPTDALSIASRARTTYYARKFAALHQISEWEVYLDVAKGKVHECEETLQKLREEVATTEGNLGMIESGMVELQRAILEAQHSCGSSNDCADVQSVD
jgi:hypothetical protein